tara:strand:- start:488 stop:625 length:138 start_codon:yes stop_codon:yes gene_type:complete
MAINWGADLDENKADTKTQIIGVIVLLVIIAITFFVVMKIRKRKK